MGSKMALKSSKKLGGPQKMRMAFEGVGRCSRSEVLRGPKWPSSPVLKSSSPPRNWEALWSWGWWPEGVWQMAPGTHSDHMFDGILENLDGWDRLYGSENCSHKYVQAHRPCRWSKFCIWHRFAAVTSALSKNSKSCYEVVIHNASGHHNDAVVPFGKCGGFEDNFAGVYMRRRDVCDTQDGSGRRQSMWGGPFGVPLRFCIERPWKAMLLFS